MLKVLKGLSSIGVIPWHIDFSGNSASLSLPILGRFFAQTFPFVKAYSSKLATSFRPNKKGRLDKLHLLLRDFVYSERASQMEFLL
jgi:hypothetical protein